MTLKPSQILSQLHAKQADFQTFDRTAANIFKEYRAALEKASRLSTTELATQLATHPSENLGAKPLEALGTFPNWIMPYGLAWQSREESLEWVRGHMTGVTTFAVDGSQIFPSKDLSIPVALVQIGWFENAHLPSGTYVKDVTLEVMTPTELKANTSGDPVDRLVNMRRFQMETDRLIQFMAERRECETCLVFFDGSLIVTFADAFDPESQQIYVDCALRLLQASEQFRVPLVGYIDTTYARDLTMMLQRLYKLPDGPAIHDAQLLGRKMAWGDRTPLFLCQRSGILAKYQDHQDAIVFTYLKTTQDNYPVRLEFPRWLYESGQMNQVLDWVRGEVIIGSGYPYAIETADQTAVLQSADRQTFQRIFQEWAEEQDLDLRLSRKMVSKVRRR